MKMKTRTNQPVEGDELENLEVSGELKAFENIVDKDGHKRFIEGDGVPLEKEGFTSTYCKWSLSGTHLMCVLAGTIADTTAITATDSLAKFYCPAWVMAKIFPVWSNNIEAKNIIMFASDWTQQNLQVKVQKANVDDTYIINFEAGAVTLTKDRNFRVQFDLLIDNE